MATSRRGVKKTNGAGVTAGEVCRRCRGSDDSENRAKRPMSRQLFVPEQREEPQAGTAADAGRHERTFASFTLDSTLA